MLATTAAAIRQPVRLAVTGTTITAAAMQEAASLREGAFAVHLAAPDKDALLDVESAVDTEFEEEHPQHERLEKLLSVKVRGG